LAVAAGEEAALRFVQTSWAIFTDGPLNILTHSFFSGKDLSKNKKNELCNPSNVQISLTNFIRPKSIFFRSTPSDFKAR
jgi:hypothetical protein